MIEYGDVYRLTHAYDNTQLLRMFMDMTVCNQLSVDATRYIFEYINSVNGPTIHKRLICVCETYYNLNTPLPTRIQEIALISFECGDIDASVFKYINQQDYSKLLNPLITHITKNSHYERVYEIIQKNPFIDTNEFMDIFGRMYNKQKLMNGHHT